MSANLTSRQAVLNQLELIIFDGGTLDDAQANLRETLDDQDRRFASHMLMVCLRRYYQSEKIIAAHVKSPFKKKYRLAQLVLHMGIAQLLWMETPDHAAIHTAVSLAKKNNLSHQSGLVNAVLKKIIKEGEGKSSAVDTLPKWLKQSWEKSYGADVARQIAEIQVQEPALDIIVKDDAKGWAEKLGADVLIGNTVRGASGAVTALDGFDAGEWWVQDVAASLPVQLLGDVGMILGETNSKTIANALNYLITHEDAMRDMQTRAYARSKQFDIQICTDRIDAIRASVMGHEEHVNAA